MVCMGKLISKCKRIIKKIIYGYKYRKPNIIEYDPNYFEKLNKIQPCPTGNIFANNNIEYNNYNNYNNYVYGGFYY